MDLEKLSMRAMEIRGDFGRLAASAGSREWTKEEVMQGFVGDVGDLMKLVMAKSGLRSMGNTDEKLAHELADCLWSILVLSKLYDVDLEQAFSRTMNELELTLQNQLAASRSTASS